MSENILMTVANDSESMAPYLKNYKTLITFVLSNIVFFFTNAKTNRFDDWEEAYDHLKWDTYLEIKENESFSKLVEVIPDFFDDNRDYIVNTLYPACRYRKGLKTVQYLRCDDNRITFLIRIVKNAKSKHI